MSGKLHFSMKHDGGEYQAIAQHEGGQTFYREFKRVKHGNFLLNSPHWCAELSSIPSGNYIVAYARKGGSVQDSSRRTVTVMDGEEIKVEYY